MAVVFPELPPSPDPLPSPLAAAPVAPVSMGNEQTTLLQAILRQLERLTAISEGRGLTAPPAREDAAPKAKDTPTNAAPAVPAITPVKSQQPPPAAPMFPPARPENWDDLTPKERVIVQGIERGQRRKMRNLPPGQQIEKTEEDGGQQDWKNLIERERRGPDQKNPPKQAAFQDFEFSGTPDVAGPEIAQTARRASSSPADENTTPTGPAGSLGGDPNNALDRIAAILERQTGILSEIKDRSGGSYV